MITITQTDSLLKAKKNNVWVFCTLWVITFVLYLPAAKAGWVIDATGFIYNLKHQNFWDYINTTQSKTQSFYQLVALHYFVFYKLWGLNLWLWSLLYITLQAINAFLLFTLCRSIFSDSGVKNEGIISLCGIILFTLCPHISEVLIWKACYHYLQGFLFILLIMRWVQKYQHQQKSKYIWYSLLIFILSAFALEIFYLIPVFVFSLALYYRIALGYDKAIFKKTITRFFVPLILLLCLYFAALFVRYRFFSPHMANTFSQSAIAYLCKPPKYLFHILALGRYYPFSVKEKVYSFCESIPVLIIFYSIFIGLWLFVIARFRSLDGNGKAMALLLFWSTVTIAFLMPLPFPDAALLVFYDRYTYFADGFVYMLLAMVLWRVANKYIALMLIIAYGLINLNFTIKVNTYWKHAAYINTRLLNDLPETGNKTVILLNIPENMNGVPMIGAQPDGQYKAMRELMAGKVSANKMYDAASYNMVTMNDGAHVTVLNDSTVNITLNQWGTWWWYEGHGGKSYETPDYRLDMKDVGHWYQLILKKPKTNFLLLYSIGSRWKIVDMNKRNEDQY